MSANEALQAAQCDFNDCQAHIRNLTMRIGMAKVDAERSAARLKVAETIALADSKAFDDALYEGRATADAHAREVVTARKRRAEEEADHDDHHRHHNDKHDDGVDVNNHDNNHLLLDHAEVVDKD